MLFIDDNIDLELKCLAIKSNTETNINAFSYV